VEQKPNILVVDNEPNLVKVVKETFGDSFEVTSSFSFEECLERARMENPSLIILGYLEPRGTSFKLHKELRDGFTTKTIPLLVVDVRPEEHSRKGWRMEEGLRMEADDYTSYPIEPAELREIVGEILRRSYSKPIELKEVLEQVEGVLKRINKIEKLLVK